MRLPFGLFLFASLATLSARVAAVSPTVAVGEVSAHVAGADASTETVLRGLVTREIQHLRLDQSRRDEGYVFSASLVKFDARATRDGARATCVVSGVLRRAGSGAIVAMMQGRGAAEDGRTALASVKAEALEAAVRGAVRHLPDAM